MNVWPLKLGNDNIYHADTVQVVPTDNQECDLRFGFEGTFDLFPNHVILESLEH